MFLGSGNRLAALWVEYQSISTPTKALLLSGVPEPPFSKLSGIRAEYKMPEREILGPYSKPTKVLLKSEALNPAFL